ncbi:MAG: TRAP transporter large permease [Synergistaceae bacterium]|jgi:C4-dicarboxylate transporter DctM subunit|nr:TRAP transporter large permease [Synergistaceae bacterium]
MNTILISMVAMLFFLMLSNVPIGFAIAGACAFTLTFVTANPLVFKLLPQAMVSSIDSFPLMAIPFFMLIGTLMSKTGLSKDIIGVAEAAAGDSPGGLGSAAIVACMIFASISGSGPAVVAALGSILVPAMLDRGYGPAYSGALCAAGATIGPVIPPSIPMIVYGVTGGVSVVSMFTGGFIPGILMGAALITANYIISKKRGYAGAARGGGGKWVLKQCWKAKWALGLPFIVLGGIYGGVFTPTEAAVIGCVYSFLVGKFVYRSLDAKAYTEALIEAAVMSAIIMFILGGATTFGRILTMERIPQQLASALLGLTQSPVLIMTMIMMILLVGGMFLDTISNIVLFTPLFLPIVKSLGYDPVFFGVLMTINLCIGFITPPVGINLYVAQSLTKAPFEMIIKEAFTLVLVLLAVMFVVMLFPSLVLFLPGLLGR